MKLPNAELATIEEAKIVRYLLDADHPDGGSKARLLLSLGYTAADWRRLADDLRSMHLWEGVVEIKETAWGPRFEIVAPITGPRRDTRVFRSVWQIDLGQHAPRLITMYPE
jgi:hypothetical protein